MHQSRASDGRAIIAPRARSTELRPERGASLRRLIEIKPRRTGVPLGARLRRPVADVVQAPHDHRVEDLGSLELDALGDRDPVEAGLRLTGERTDAKKVADDPSSPSGFERAQRDAAQGP